MAPEGGVRKSNEMLPASCAIRNIVRCTAWAVRIMSSSGRALWGKLGTCCMRSQITKCFKQRLASFRAARKPANGSASSCSVRQYSISLNSSAVTIKHCHEDIFGTFRRILAADWLHAPRLASLLELIHSLFRAQKQYDYRQLSLSFNFERRANLCHFARPPAGAVDFFTHPAKLRWTQTVCSR